MVTAGDGTLQLLRYNYPDKRSMVDTVDSTPKGVQGTVEQVIVCGCIEQKQAFACVGNRWR